MFRLKVILLLGLFAVPVHAQTPKDIRAFIYGNSLIHHLTDTDETTVPHWLYLLAQAGGHGFAADGRWGFLSDFAADLPPEPNWSFDLVPSVWNTDAHAFRRAGFDTVIFNPTNFIQYQGPDRPYDGDNPRQATPLSDTLRVFEYTAGQLPGARFYVYEGWAELGDYPPSARQMRRYHAYNIDEYHAWYLDYVAALQADLPTLDITLIPVASVLSQLLTETGLEELAPEDLYSDDAPHGTATLYFLAAMVTYASLYAEQPPAIALPETVHPLVRDSYPQVAAFIWAAVSGAVLPEGAGAQGLIPETGLPNPSLAMGLNGISDWSTQQPFIDLMKTARPWIGHLPGQWGGYDAAMMQAAGYLDPHGWPLAIPEGVERIETFFLTDQPAGAVSLSGRYRLTFAGRGDVTVGALAQDVEVAPGEIWFSYRPAEGLVSVAISAIDPVDPVRDIVVVREDHIPLHDLGLTFNPDWIARIRDLRVLRFMDWMGTNGSAQTLWEDRPLPGDFSYAVAGVPAEVMVDLANQIGADPWFTMPHLADDAYVAAFAALVHERLDPQRVAYVEYSNELWNFIFPQTLWVQEQARARWGEGAGDDAFVQFAGLRAAQVADIWAAAFADAPERLVRVVATHTGWPGLEVPLLEAPLAQAEGLPAPHLSFDAYAVSGYFGHELGSEDLSARVLGWVEDGTATERAAGVIRAGSLAELIDDLFPYHAGVARAHDLTMIMYEGGTHIVGHGGQVDNDALTAFFASFNYSPEMAGLYAEALEGWESNGGILFNAFVDVAAPSKWGSWGALRHLDDLNPRWATLMAFNALPGDAARDGAFTQGIHAPGTSGDDALSGTGGDDILIGGDGDDNFDLIAGRDHVHGGEGFDVVTLPGLPDAYVLGRDGEVMLATSETLNVRMLGIDAIGFADMPGRLTLPEQAAP